ncbi:MAG: preprotein translocase subunit YajC [Clostridium sp.]|nr:preprotein translocase subunit YajC [Prevotella sp.]MCM1428219.1 preprotein translocase subunit YajC [Clostridium sp.]MCM1475949.1 preprotein translocase subunit YajC [Muribaculaceae bacterium]
MISILNAILLEAVPGNGSGFSGIFMIVAMIVIFYFFMIRPQNKKQKELKQAREALKKGDKIVTAGGIHGKIREIRDSLVHVEVAPNVSITVSRDSIYPAIEAAASSKKSDSKESKKEESSQKAEKE